MKLLKLVQSLCSIRKRLLLLIVVVAAAAVATVVAGGDTIVCCFQLINIVLILLRGQCFVFGGVIDNVVINCRRVAFLVVCSGG